jgi:2-C-methyl-D-erythritol 4-phosphate cytidylyltransferase
MKIAVILPAAGLGTRMGKTPAEKAGTSRKQFMLLEGSPIIIHTVRKFAANSRVGEIVVAVREEDIDWVKDMLAKDFGNRVRVVAGGDSRQESVENALSTLQADTDLVAVHDAVRPFIDPATIDQVLNEAGETGAAIVGVPAVDTVKRVSRGTTRVKIRETLPREKLVMAQTPQVFRYDILTRAFQSARQDGFSATDEASMVERLDVDVTVVPGSDRNIKITKPTDLELAHLFYREEQKA